MKQPVWPLLLLALPPLWLLYSRNAFPIRYESCNLDTTLGPELTRFETVSTRVARRRVRPEPPPTGEILEDGVAAAYYYGAYEHIIARSVGEQALDLRELVDAVWIDPSHPILRGRHRHRRSVTYPPTLDEMELRSAILDEVELRITAAELPDDAFRTPTPACERLAARDLAVGSHLTGVADLMCLNFSRAREFLPEILSGTRQRDNTSPNHPTVQREYWEVESQCRDLGVLVSVPLIEAGLLHMSGDANESVKLTLAAFHVSADLDAGASLSCVLNDTRPEVTEAGWALLGSGLEPQLLTAFLDGLQTVRAQWPDLRAMIETEYVLQVAPYVTALGAHSAIHSSAPAVRDTPDVRARVKDMSEHWSAILDKAGTNGGAGLLELAKAGSYSHPVKHRGRLTARAAPSALAAATVLCRQVELDGLVLAVAAEVFAERYGRRATAVEELQVISPDLPRLNHITGVAYTVPPLDVVSSKAPTGTDDCIILHALPALR